MTVRLSSCMFIYFPILADFSATLGGKQIFSNCNSNKSSYLTGKSKVYTLIENYFLNIAKFLT